MGTVYNRTMTNVDTDTSLGLEAVGLWHKMHANFGDEFDQVDIMTLHPDPNAWGPFDESHDLEGPLSQLLAIGYAEEISASRIRLYYERGDDGPDTDDQT